MDSLALIARYEAILREKKIPKMTMYKACGISDAAVSQWRRGKTIPAMRSIERIAAYLDVTPEYLLTGEDAKKAPVLTDQDRRDIAQDLERIMEALDVANDLRFNGDPLSGEARESIRAAIKLGLEAAKAINKEWFAENQGRQGQTAAESETPR